VNLDGSITTADAVLTARLASRTGVTPGLAYDNADVAGPVGNYRDNAIDWRDVARILRAAGGLEELPDTPVSFLSRVRDLVTVEGDTSKDYALNEVLPESSYYVVSGHISGVPDSTVTNILWFYHFFQEGGASGSGTGPDANGDYHITLAPDDYLLYFGGTVAEETAAGTLTWDYTTDLNRDITVAGPLIVDVTAAAPPTPGQLTGEVNTTNLIPTRIDCLSRPDFASALDPTKALLRLTGIVGKDAYLLKGVPLPYSIFVGAVYEPAPSITFSWSLTDPVTLPAGSTVGPPITLPEVVPVSLRFTPPAGADVISTAFSHSAISGGSLGTQSSVAPGSNLYRAAFVPGASHASITLALDRSETVQRTIFYQTTITIPDEGGEQAVSLPPLPEMATFSGKVTLPGGFPAPNETISLSETAPADGGTAPYGMSARITTDSEGRFSVAVIPGQYQVQIPATLF
jgi:hypothetical protein